MSQQKFDNVVQTCSYIMDITIGFGQLIVKRQEKKQVRTHGDVHGNVSICVELDNPTSQNNDSTFIYKTSNNKIFINISEISNGLCLSRKAKVEFRLECNNEAVYIKVSIKPKENNLVSDILSPNDVHNYFKSLGATDEHLSKVIPEFLSGKVLQIASDEDLKEKFGLPYGLIMLYRNKK